MRCDNCHREFKPHSYGTRENYFSHNFCSWACSEEWEQKIHNQNVMRGLLVRQRIQEQEQAELQRQQEQQARQERYQELNATAKEYGFTDIAEALKYAKQAGVAGTTDENEFFEKAAEEKKEFEEFIRKHRAYIAERNEETEKNARYFREQLQSVMTEEQKEKFSILRRKSALLFDIGTLKKTLFALELIFVPVLGILLYGVLPRSINFLRIYGFWSTLFTSVAIALILKDPIEIAISKNRVKKVAEIKGDDDFPFYELSFGYLSNSLHFNLSVYMRFGICLLITALVFRYSIYIPINYLKWILRILSVLLLVWVTNASISSERPKIVDGFKITSDDRLAEYCIYKYIRKVLGPFCLPKEERGGTSADSDTFSEWCINDMLNLYGWKYTFLPDKENPEFKEKYGFLTTSKYFSFEDIKNDFWENKNQKSQKKKTK